MNLNEYLTLVAIDEDKTLEEVRASMELAIEDAYNSGNPRMCSIGKDGKKPTIEELFEFMVKEAAKRL